MGEFILREGPTSIIPGCAVDPSCTDYKYECTGENRAYLDNADGTAYICEACEQQQETVKKTCAVTHCQFEMWKTTSEERESTYDCLKAKKGEYVNFQRRSCQSEQLRASNVQISRQPFKQICGNCYDHRHHCMIKTSLLRPM